MKKEFNHNFYGLILSIGGIVHLLTNMFWKIIPIERIGEWLYFFGLFFGVTCFLFVSRQYFKNKSFLFYLVSDFFLNLSMVINHSIYRARASYLWLCKDVADY